MNWKKTKRHMHLYRRNQISSILTDLQSIIGNILEVPGSARNIIALFGGKYLGTSP